MIKLLLLLLSCFVGVRELVKKKVGCSFSLTNSSSRLISLRLKHALQIIKGYTKRRVEVVNHLERS